MCRRNYDALDAVLAEDALVQRLVQVDCHHLVGRKQSCRQPMCAERTCELDLRIPGDATACEGGDALVEEADAGFVADCPGVGTVDSCQPPEPIDRRGCMGSPLGDGDHHYRTDSGRHTLRDPTDEPVQRLVVLQCQPVKVEPDEVEVRAAVRRKGQCVVVPSEHQLKVESSVLQVRHERWLDRLDGMVPPHRHSACQLYGFVDDDRSDLGAAWAGSGENFLAFKSLLEVPPLCDAHVGEFTEACSSRHLQRVTQ